MPYAKGCKSYLFFEFLSSLLPNNVLKIIYLYLEIKIDVFLSLRRQL